MTRTVDIAATLGGMKQPHQRLIGFALETESELEHAKGKLERKNLDMIVLNSLRDPGAGFATDTNKITLIWPNNKTREFGLKPKSAVAMDIVAGIVDLFSV
jgi:phosphopantothenoylcysteine decarboxylase/phosphopantothenate--cysteine ligase